MPRRQRRRPAKGGFPFHCTGLPGVLLLIVLATAGCMKAADEAGPTSTPTPPPAAAPVGVETPTEATGFAETPQAASASAPGALPGLAPADVQASLEDLGLACTPAEESGEGYAVRTCKREGGRVSLVVRFYSRTGSTVDCIDVRVVQFGQPQDDVAASLLGTVAGMPYDGAEPDQARAWVAETLPSLAPDGVKSTSIGGVAFSLSGTPGERTFEMGERP